MKRFHLTILSCALLMSPCGAFLASADEQSQASEKKAEASKLEKYENKEKNYSINYPADWQKKEMPKLDLVLFAPSKDAKTQPLASMNVVSEKVDAPVTLDVFYKESVENLSSALKNVHVEKNGDLKLNDLPSKWVIYTHEMQGMKFTVLQYFVVSKDMIYLLTFSATTDSFESFRPDFEKTALSFHLLANPS